MLAEFDRQWSPWTDALATIMPTATREPGVCGTWSIHDVVNHVQHYVRYHLVNVRAAFTHVPPTQQDIQGARDRMPQAGNTLDARNEAMRRSGVSLTWQELVAEAAWLRAQTHAWIAALTPAQLHEAVGWVNFWEPGVPKPDALPLHVRRVAEAPAAKAPQPVWQFVLPDCGPGGHVTEHLGHIRPSASR